MPTCSFFRDYRRFPDMICNRGTGAGAGPYIAIHEGFQGVIAAFVLTSFVVLIITNLFLTLYSAGYLGRVR